MNINEMVRYTHSLKIALIDSNGHIVCDDSVMNLIKTKLMDPHMHVLYFDNKTHYISISWDKVNTSELANLFMGDMFTQSIYEFDDILYEHTHKTFDIIEKLISGTPYKINFYISRLPTTSIPVTPELYGTIV